MTRCPRCCEFHPTPLTPAGEALCVASGKYIDMLNYDHASIETLKRLERERDAAEQALNQERAA